SIDSTWNRPYIYLPEPDFVNHTYYVKVTDKFTNAVTESYHYPPGDGSFMKSGKENQGDTNINSSKND
nr:hypothetical protein [Bacteroidota bacterium]